MLDIYLFNIFKLYNRLRSTQWNLFHIFLTSNQFCTKFGSFAWNWSHMGQWNLGPVCWHKALATADPGYPAPARARAWPWRPVCWRRVPSSLEWPNGHIKTQKKNTGMKHSSMCVHLRVFPWSETTGVPLVTNSKDWCTSQRKHMTPPWKLAKKLHLGWTKTRPDRIWREGWADVSSARPCTSDDRETWSSQLGKAVELRQGWRWCPHISARNGPGSASCAEGGDVSVAAADAEEKKAASGPARSGHACL
jgi:hypothetical protein